MRTRPGVFGAVATAGLLVVACRGGGSLDLSGRGGTAGGPQPAGGAAGGGVRNGGLDGGATNAPDGGWPADGGRLPDAGQAPDAGGTVACKPLGAIPRRVWLLSAEQWGNAVQSLLSLPAPPVLTSRGGELLYQLWDDASLTVDTPMLYDIYNLLSTATGQIDPLVGTTIASCVGATPDAQTSCATTFVRAFAEQAYRRPIADDEMADLMDLYQQGATTSYASGIELVMQAVLASPSFLFRTELGSRTLTADAQGNFPDTTLTPYEVASQLSFTLVGNIPDAPLTAAAADGSLATTAGITAQIDRLLAEPAAQSYLTDVVLNWLGIVQLSSKVKDPTLLWPLSATGSTPDQSAIAKDLLTSARQFVDAVLWKGSGKIDDLLTSPNFFVNARLAKLYPDAVVATPPADDNTFVPATWPASEGRSGLLTQPSYLWAQSDPAINSIVKRGKEIHDDVLCQDPIGSPEPATPSSENVLLCKSADGTQTLSTCDSEVLKADARLSVQPCQVCHQQMDPYALVLQNFGPIGNYRTVDEAGRPIDPVATYVATQPAVTVDTTFNETAETVTAPGSPLAPRTLTGAHAFAKAVVETGAFDGCAAQRLLGTAIGWAIYTNDTCELRPIRAASDGTIKSLYINLLSPDFMRARAGGPQ